jgi:hypothetical protein
LSWSITCWRLLPPLLAVNSRTRCFIRLIDDE